MTIQKLPPEIVQKIFENTDPVDIRNLLFVCKKWYTALEQIYFKYITWSGKEKIQWLKKQLSTMDDKSNKNPFRSLPMTKRLQMYFDVDYESDFIDNEYTSPSTRFTKEEFLFLLSLFPNLKSLNISQSVHRMHYMKVLDSCEPHQLPQLKEIVVGNDYVGSLHALYFGICYKLRRSLEIMDITYNNSYVLGFGKELLELFPDFNNLRQLEIYNKTDSTLTLFHLLKACPNLSTLIYTSTFLIPVNSTQILTDFLQTLKDRKSSTSDFLKHLKTVKVSIPTLTKSYMDFFAYHSPKSLDNVDFNLTDIDLYTWLNEVSVAVGLNFCESLHRFSSVELTFECPEHELAGVGRLPVLRSDAKINLFDQILNALTKGRNLEYCTAKYNERRGHSARIIINNNSKLFYQYHLDYEDYGVLPPSTNYSNDISHSYYQNCTLPVPSSLERLAKLNTILFLAEPGDFDKIPRNFLDYAKYYCPRLMHFEVEYFRWKCRLKANCGNQMNSSLENMTHIAIQGAVFSQELFDSLIDYFPRIQVLDFAIDNALDLYREKIKFNLSKFESLHTFIIDVEGLSGMMYDPVFLQFQYAGSKRAVHYLITKNSKFDTQNTDGFGYSFEPISAAFMQEGIDNDMIRRTYVIYVESLPQLSMIQFTECNTPYAKLDLSQVSSVLIDESTVNEQ